MQVYITHYIVSKNNKLENQFELKDYSDSNSKWCSVYFRGHFSEFITDIPDFRWRTKVLGVRDKRIVEKLHNEDMIDIQLVEEIRDNINFDEFYKYATEEFIPKYNGEYERASVYSDEFDSEKVFYLDLYAPVYFKGIYVEQVDWFVAELPDNFLEHFTLDKLYCNKTDFENAGKIIPAECKSDFESLYESYYEEGKSILTFTIS